MKKTKKSLSTRIATPVVMALTVLACDNLYAQLPGLSSIPYVGGYLDMAQSVANGNLGALPYHGYIDMAQSIASGNWGAIPYGGGYINLAQEIASGNFSAIPYAGSYIGMAQDYAGAAYSDYHGYESYDFSVSSVSDEINFTPEESATGVNVNLYEMTALYQAQYSRAHRLEELYPAAPQGALTQDQLKGGFFTKVLRGVQPNFDALQDEEKNRLAVEVLWEIDHATSGELKTRGAIIAAAANASDNLRLDNGYQYPADYRESVAAQLVLARYGFELAKRKETSKVGVGYLATAKANSKAFLARQAPLQYANWLDNFAIRAMISGDADRALENFLEAKSVRENVTNSNLLVAAQATARPSDEYLARFYLTQYRFGEAKEHIDACLSAYEKFMAQNGQTANEQTETTRLLIAEMISNKALAEFFEGRDYDAQSDLEKANELFEATPQYVDVLKEFNEKFPKESAPQYDQSRQYVMTDNGWTPVAQYRLLQAEANKVKSQANTRVRQFEWAFGKQVANHIRLAQIHSRRLRYEIAVNELDAAKAMKRVIFDYLRRTDCERVFGRNPLVNKAAYLVDSKTRKPFVRDGEKVVWLTEKERKDREKIWKQIFNIQIVFENNIRAAMALKKGEFDEAFKLYDENVETIQANGYGEKSFMVETLRLRASAGLRAKDSARVEQARSDVAEARRILELQDGANLQYEGLIACLLGEIALERGELDEAKKEFATAEERYTEIRAANALFVDLYYGQARLARAQGRTEDAFALIDKAIACASAIRRVVSVDAHDSAVQFAAYYYLYVTKTAWLYDEIRTNPDVERGAINAEIFNVMEASRAQGFLDIMNRAKIAATEGMTPEEKAKFDAQRRANGRELRRAKLALVQATRDGADKATLDKLQTAVDAAQTRATNAYDDEKNASPVYRDFIDQGNDDASRVANFASVAAEFARDKTMVCEYMIGEDQSFLFVYGRAFANPEIYRLAINAEQKEELALCGIEVEEGAFTGDKLATIFGMNNADGLFNWVRSKINNDAESGEFGRFTRSSHALWEILFPDDSVRKAIQTKKQGTYTLIVPDGVLAQLPFEMLVVEQDPELRYLLDAETVVFYAPSISVYRQLAAKERPKNAGATLSVGDPKYAEGSGLEALDSSGAEVENVAEKCKKSGLKCEKFLQEDATERNVRENIGGKSFVHLACHGQVNYEEGALNCRLALTQGPDGDVANDGFLTLAELFTLDLNGCDCATLSACETNRGESQNGEGSWTLCRGALASGAANVIASDWSVNDESTSILVDKFFGAFIDSDDDYAVALKKAKLTLKEDYNAPYHWAPFVLIGTAKRESSNIVNPSETNEIEFSADAPARE